MPRSALTLASQTSTSDRGASGTRSYLESMIAVFCLVLAAGCSSLAGPEYERPELPEKLNWSQLESRELTTSEIIQPDWWTAFGDPYLDELISDAVTQSISLKIVGIAVDQAEVAMGQQRSTLRPNIGLAPTSQTGVTGNATRGRDVDHSQELLGLSGSWEIDLWGKLRKQLRSAEANYRMSEMEFRGAHLTLVASVANKYFRIRQIDEQIGNQMRSMDHSTTLLEIYEAQYREGMVANTRVLSQKAEIDRLTNELLEQRRGRRQAELELATLLGRPAGDLSVPVAPLRTEIQIIDVPSVLPADMLARRPDVLKAEYNLLVAHHSLGVARLRKLPTLNLTLGALAGASMVPSFINSWNFLFKADGSGMFNRGVRQQIETSEVQRRAASEAYRLAVLEALEEVEIKLLNLYTRQRQIKVQEEQVAALQVVRGVRQARLREGLVSQLELFDTERELLTAQQGVLDSYQQILSETIALYMALGGGWPEETPSDRRIAERKST